MNLSSNLIGSSNSKTNFPQKLLSTDTQVSKIRKAFANGASANMKFSKTQLSKILQLGGFLFSSGILNLAMAPIKRFFSLENSIAKELKNGGAKKINSDILVDAGLNLLGSKIKKGISSITGSGITLTNNEIKDIIKVIKSLGHRGILLKRTTRKHTSQEGSF